MKLVAKYRFSNMSNLTKYIKVTLGCVLLVKSKMDAKMAIKIIELPQL